MPALIVPQQNVLPPPHVVGSMHSKPPSIGPPPSCCIDESVPVSATPVSPPPSPVVPSLPVSAAVLPSVPPPASSVDELPPQPMTSAPIPRKVKSLFIDVSYFLFCSAAWAAASRAIGTRYGEQ